MSIVLPTNRIYSYQLIQSLIILGVTVFGLASYVENDPGRVVLYLLFGYFVSIVFLMCVTIIPPESNLASWLFYEL